MARIKIKEIKDLQTNVAINDGYERIEHIKAQFSNLSSEPEYAEVPVFDMWEDMPG